MESKRGKKCFAAHVRGSYFEKSKEVEKLIESTEVNTGWPKSNVSKVRAYYSASDHLIRKIFAGVCRDSHWFEEYLKIIETGDYFFE